MPKALPMMSDAKVKLFICKSDCDYLLEPMIDGLLASGVESKDLLKTVAASCLRILRLQMSGFDLSVPAKTLKAEAARVAEKLIERLTVKDLDMVLPFSKRRGLPAAQAA